MNTPDDRTSTVVQEPNESDLLNSDDDFPDGGLTAWLTTFGAQVFLVNITARVN